MDPIRVRSPFALPASKAPPSTPAAPPAAPLDVVSARASIPPASPPPPKKSLAGRLWKAARIGACAAVISAGTLAAIAYIGNVDAIRQPITVSRPIEAPPAAARSAEAAAATHAVAARPAAVSPSPVVVLVPGRTVHTIATQLQNSPRLRHEIAARIAETRTQIQQQLQHLPAIDQEELIDVKVPLPTGERAFLHVGSLDLPSGGLGQLEPESVPLVVKAHVQPGAARVDVDIAPLTEAKTPQGPPGAIYLGSFRTRVMPTAPNVPVDGRVDVRSDLDGTATRAALETWTQRLDKTPADSPQRGAIEANVARLQARLTQGERLQSLAASHGFRGALNEVLADQGATFRSEIPLDRGKPLLEGVHHLWLTAGTDGKPDVQVTDEVTTPGIDSLRLTHHSVHGLPHPESGGLLHAPLRAAHAEIRDRIKSEVRDQLDGFSAQLPGEVRGVVRSSWGDATHQLRDAIGPELHAAFKQHDHFTLDLHNPRVPMPLAVQIGNVSPTADGFLAARVSLQPGLRGVTGDVSRFVRDRSLLPQSVRTDTAFVAVSGDALNAALQDVKRGGSVDWQGMLNDVARQNNLKSLQFDHDAHGRLMTPQIAWKNGGAVVEFEITAEAQGTQPVRAVTGAVSGATGVTDQAARKLQDGLGEAAGAPGKVIGTVVRAPSFLLDQIVGGVKSVVDNTVGVVDRAPEAATRPVVSLRLSFPLRVEAHNGILSIRPQADGLELGDAQGQNNATLTPGNILQSMIARAVVTSNPEIAQKVAEAQLPVDLRAHGLEFTTASVVAPAAGHKAPDFVVGVAPSPQLDLGPLTR